MALPPISKNTFDRRNIAKTDYNGISFSLAWLKDDQWKTYYRKFHLCYRRHMLIGQYPQNLYFDEEFDFKQGDFQFMIYGIPSDTKYKKIIEEFKKNNFDFLLFKKTFILKKKNIDFYSPNLKFFKDAYIRLYHHTHQLQIKIYKSSRPPSPDTFGITLPIIHIPIKNIPSFSIRNLDKSN